MEEGSLRCDLNVSIAPIATEEEGKKEKYYDDDDILNRTGNRVEVKNLNSIRQVQQAAKYEAILQAFPLPSIHSLVQVQKVHYTKDWQLSQERLLPLFYHLIVSWLPLQQYQTFQLPGDLLSKRLLGNPTVHSHAVIYPLRPVVVQVTSFLSLLFHVRYLEAWILNHF